jgi:hypothetical protein
VGRAERIALALFMGLACLLTWWVRDQEFFWDTVQLGAKHAYHFYDNQLRLSLLPASIDSGHPPLFGYYLAVCWTLLGKTLLVSHLAILPFLLGIIYLGFRLNAILAPASPGWMLPLLLFADPVLAAQSVLVSPDIPLCLFFLLGIYSIFRRRPLWLAVAVAGLGLISMRGMMCGALLFLWELLAFRPKRLGMLLPYLPGGLLAAAFLGWHYAATGWIGYHADSPWAPSFARSDLAGILRNVMILAWRMLDFGRIFLWLILAYILYRHRAISLLQRQLGLLLVLSMVILSPSLLLHQALSAHRYLLPIFLALSLFAMAVLSAHPRAKRSWWFAMAVIGLISGHSWIYPNTIAQGWDASLAHLPYYGLRREALQYMEQQAIPLSATGTAFPEIGPIKYRDLSDRAEGMKAKSLQTDRYILWSNVMNDFSDAETRALQQDWQLLQQWQKGGVTIRLYQHPIARSSD